MGNAAAMKVLGLAIGLLGGGLVFYAIDHLLMGAQGLQVGWDLMPK